MTKKQEHSGIELTTNRALVAGAMLGVLVPTPARTSEKFSDTHGCEYATAALLGYLGEAEQTPTR